MPAKLKVLNSKESKEIKKLLNAQFRFENGLDYVFLKNEKDKIYIASRDISKANLDLLNTNTIGLYFAQLKDEKLRLSIEGSQLIGRHCNKNIVEIDDVQLRQWFRGENIGIEKTDISKNFHLKEENFLILKHKNGFVGCGKYANGIILNFVGKERRAKL